MNISDLTDEEYKAAAEIVGNMTTRDLVNMLIASWGPEDVAEMMGRA